MSITREDPFSPVSKNRQTDNETKMPAYHSKKDGSAFDEACGCSVLPLRTKFNGPSYPPDDDEDDIVDEVINTFRANVFFRNFDIRGSADRTLIYLTLHMSQCLVKLEKIEDKATALRELRALSTRPFACPGEPGWNLGSMFPAAANKSEGDLFKAFMKQAREELAVRLIEKVFEADGTKNKWWQAFSKRKFMNKELST